EQIDAEPSEPGRAPGAVVIAQLVDAVPVPLRDQPQCELPGLLGRELLARDRDHLALDPRPRELGRLDVDVRSPLLHRRRQNLGHLALLTKDWSSGTRTG